MSYNRARLKSSLPRPTIAAPTRDSDKRPPEVPRQAASPSRPPPRAERGALIRERVAMRTVASKRRLQRPATPLKVLQQPIQAGMRKVFDLRRLLFVVGLTLIVLLLPTPAGLSLEGHKAIALFVFSGLILALEPAPLPIVALLVPIVQIALGVDDAGGAFAPFGTPVVFLIMGSLFLAEALRKHGLTRRLALHAIVGSGGRFGPLLLALMAITGGLSMFVLNTATAAVLIPVAITIAQQIPRPEDGRKALAVLILAIGYSSSIGAIATIMGSGENAIASGLLQQLYGFGFIDWMKYGLPVALLLIPLAWVLLQRLFALPKLTIDIEPARREIERLGRLTGPETRDHRRAAYFGEPVGGGRLHRASVEAAHHAIEQRGNRHRRGCRTLGRKDRRLERSERRELGRLFRYRRRVDAGRCAGKDRRQRLVRRSDGAGIRRTSLRCRTWRPGPAGLLHHTVHEQCAAGRDSCAGIDYAGPGLGDRSPAPGDPDDIRGRACICPAERFGAG